MHGLQLMHSCQTNSFSNQIMQRCTAVFETWDDEFEKFANQLREMSKKKREQSIKFTWKANTYGSQEAAGSHLMHEGVSTTEGSGCSGYM